MPLLTSARNSRLAGRCGFCRSVRLLVVCAASGLAAAWLARKAGLNGNPLMLATFAGAILPLMIAARRRRIGRDA